MCAGTCEYMKGWQCHSWHLCREESRMVSQFCFSWVYIAFILLFPSRFAAEKAFILCSLLYHGEAPASAKSAIGSKVKVKAGK